VIVAAGHVAVIRIRAGSGPCPWAKSGSRGLVHRFRHRLDGAGAHCLWHVTVVMQREHADPEAEARITGSVWRAVAAQR
jgi:hypothetical protein